MMLGCEEAGTHDDMRRRTGRVLLKRFLEKLKLDALSPDDVLIHSVWESRLIDMSELLGMTATTIPASLQKAWVVVELQTVPHCTCCQHKGPMVSGRVLCSFLESGSTLIPAELMKLTSFLSEHPLPQSWRLCSTCKDRTWCARAVTSEALQDRMERSLHMHRWAALSTTFDVTIPLVPVSNLPYQQVFETGDGERVYHAGSKAGSTSRAAHELRGDGYSQQKTRHGQLNPFQFHAYFWLFSLIHDEIRVKLRCTDAPKRGKFSSRMALLLAQGDWGPDVRDSFSRHFQQVVHPIKLTQAVKDFLFDRTASTQNECWGFKGLRQHEVGFRLLELCASAVNTFSWLLPEVAIFKSHV